MRIYSLLFLACALLCLGAGVAQSKDPAQPEFIPTITIREIMQSMVMPEADVLWGAVSISVTEKGVEEKGPKTDEEWAKLRYQAVTLAEASNLILMNGRHIARPGDKGDKVNDPNALAPEKIEALIKKDPANWTKFAHEMYKAATVAIKAIDSRKLQAVADAGDGLNTACENCHKQYWYPEPAKPGDKKK